MVSGMNIAQKDLMDFKILLDNGIKFYYSIPNLMGFIILNSLSLGVK
jgi:hypothetical protein